MKNDISFFISSNRFFSFSYSFPVFEKSFLESYSMLFFFLCIFLSILFPITFYSFFFHSFILRIFAFSFHTFQSSFLFNFLYFFLNLHLVPFSRSQLSLYVSLTSVCIFVNIFIILIIPKYPHCRFSSVVFRCLSSFILIPQF